MTRLVSRKNGFLPQASRHVPAGPHAFVFIDARVADIGILLGGIVPGAEVRLLDPARDGLAQIAEFLQAAGARRLSTISIVAHGAPGQLEIGPNRLDVTALLARGANLSVLAAALADDGVLQLYACETGRGSAGRAFTSALSAALGGRAVVASTIPLGDGRPWDLDARAGVAPAASIVAPITRAAQTGYRATLAANTAPSFSTVGDGIVTTTPGVGTKVTQLADGKLLVAGSSGSSSAVIRYNANGSLDTTFGTGGKALVQVGGGSTAYGIVVQPDGKILLGGIAYQGSNDHFSVVRFNANGTLDTSFGSGGQVITVVGSFKDVARGIALQSTGKILLGGWAVDSSATFALVRYNTDGSLDTSFGSGGKISTPVGDSDSQGSAIVVQPDDKIILVGSGSGDRNDFGLVRYNPNGTLDTTFGTGGKVLTPFGDFTTDDAYGVTLQPNGKILVTGMADGAFGVARYNANGTLDTTFGSGGKVQIPVGGYSKGSSVAVQTDGKIVLGGWGFGASSYDFAVIRLNANGTFDTSFGSGGTVTTPVGPASDNGNSVIVQPDGKIVLAGSANNGSGNDFAIVRYNTDGSLDKTFDSVNTLDGAPTYIENGTPVVLDSDVAVADSELRAAGNYAGATLTLARSGGASTDDRFGATGTLSALTEGNALVVGGVTVGTVTTNSGGTLVLTFSGTNATEARVNSVMRQITYANASDAPPSTANIAWTFSDGNTGAQGTGGASVGTGNTIVSITSVNDAPTGLNKSVTTDEDTPYTFATTDFGFSDTDGNTFKAVRISSLPTAGTLKNNGTAVTFGQLVSVADITAGKLVYTPASNASGAPYGTFTFQVQDNGGTTNNGRDLAVSANTFTFNVTAVNDAPVVTAPGNLFVNEGASLDLRGQIAVSDVDGGSGTETLTLSVGEGIIDVAAGASGATVEGSGTGTVKITGTIAQLQALLGTDDDSSVSYTSLSGAPSALVDLTITLDDGGNTGTGSAKTTSVTPTINLAADDDVTGISTDVGSGAAVGTGAEIVFTLTTETSVTVDGVPQLVLNNGGRAIYSGTDDSGNPQFTYTVASGEDTSDLKVTGFDFAEGAIYPDDGPSFDPSSVAGAPGADTGIAIDATAPATPAAPVLAKDTGILSDDKLTRDPTIIYPTPADGNTLLYSTDGTTYATTPPAFTADGTYTVSIKERDAVGNLSGASSLTFTYDRTAPAAPMSLVLAPGQDTGSSSTDGYTSVNTFSLSGTAQAGLTINLYRDAGVLLGTTIVATDGTFTFTTPVIPDGLHSIYAATTDDAGNRSASSRLIKMTIDATAPATPSAPTLSPVSDSGTQGDGHTTVAQPMMTGTAEVGSTVTLYDSDGTSVLGTAVVGSGGTYAITSSTLSLGAHTLSVKATDKAGNVSTRSPATSVTIDQLSRPSAPDLNDRSDSGISATDDVTYVKTPTFTGTTAANATVQVYEGATLLGTGRSGANGVYSVTASVLTDGTHTLKVMATDAFGNTSTLSDGLTIKIDTVAPAAPSSPALTTASDTGTSSSDGLTNVATPTVTGTAEAGSTVTLYRDAGVQIGSMTLADNETSYSFMTPALTDGLHSLYTRVTDAAGNLSPVSALRKVTIDTQAPNTAINGGDQSVMSANQTITGTGEAGTRVVLSDNNATVGTTTVAANGTWSATITLSPGANTIVAAGFDKAGNNRDSEAVVYTYTAASAMRSLRSMVQAMATATPASSSALTPSAPAAPADTHLAAAHG